MDLNKIFSQWSSQSKKIFSIDFGQAFIKIVCLEKTGGRWALLARGARTIKRGAGEQGLVASFIKDIASAHNVASPDIILTVSDPRAILYKHLILPALSREELRAAIQWQLKAEIPFDIRKAVFDWTIFREFADEEGAKKVEVLCVLVEPEFIQKRLAFVGSSSGEVVRISTNPFNYTPFLGPVGSACCAVLDIGSDEAMLCIYKEDQLFFVRSLAFCPDKLIQALTTTLTTDKGKLELSAAEAEEIIKTFGIPLDESVFLNDKIAAIHVVSLVRPFLESLIKELKRSFDYFASRFKEEPPSILYLTGGGACLKNLESYLLKELKLRVGHLSLAAGIAEGLGLACSEHQIAGAVGAVLMGRQAIDLLPQDVKAKKFEFVEKASLRLVALALGLVFVLAFILIKFQGYDYQKRLKISSMHLEAIRDVKALKTEIDTKEALMARIEKGKVPAAGLLKTVSSLLPREIILIELALDQGRHEVRLKGVVSAGTERGEAVLTNFMKKIEASAFFSEAGLISLKKNEGFQEFEIRALCATEKKR